MPEPDARCQTQYAIARLERVEGIRTYPCAYQRIPSPPSSLAASASIPWHLCVEGYVYLYTCWKKSLRDIGKKWLERV